MLLGSLSALPATAEGDVAAAAGAAPGAADGLDAAGAPGAASSFFASLAQPAMNDSTSSEAAMPKWDSSFIFSSCLFEMADGSVRGPTLPNCREIISRH